LGTELRYENLKGWNIPQSILQTANTPELFMNALKNSGYLKEITIHTEPKLEEIHNY